MEQPQIAGQQEVELGSEGEIGSEIDDVGEHDVPKLSNNKLGQRRKHKTEATQPKAPCYSFRNNNNHLID